MPVHQFHLKAVWNGGRNGTGNLEAGNLRTAISVPREMNGPGVGTNPDEMLLGASATCFLITLAAILENRKLPVLELSLESEAFVREEGRRLTFERIVHRPKMAVPSKMTDKERESILQAAMAAEKACMISRALHGNVKIEVEPQFTIQE
jgi:peroxiredoxin-like protein